MKDINSLEVRKLMHLNNWNYGETIWFLTFGEV